MFEALTPKSLILKVIRERLQGTGITKIVLVFDLNTNKYNVMLRNDDGSSMKLDVTADEINTVKKIFIDRIVAQWNKKYKHIVPTSTILEVDLSSSEFNVFMLDTEKKAHKFDF